MTKKIILERVLIKAYILILIFEGPIRYALNRINLATLIYVKDGIILLILLLGLKKIKFNRQHFILFAIIISSLFMSIIYISNYGQIGFFIIKVLAIFLAGLTQYKNILQDIQENKRFYIICFVITVGGVLLNDIVRFPWEGVTYEIGDNIVTASREWSTLGQQRLAGFTRSSINTATYIMFFAMLIQLNKKIKKPVKIICCILTFYSIYLTTTKGMLIACILFYVMNFFKFTFNKKIIISILIGFMIFLPIFSTICEPFFDFLMDNLDYEIYTKYFASFKDRLCNTWPRALELATKRGNWILGRGMGGIDSSQTVYERLLYCPADNMFVYLYVTFGLPSLLFFYYIIKNVNKMTFENQSEIYMYNILLISCAYGIVSNVLEGSLLCLILGGCIRKYDEFAI